MNCLLVDDEAGIREGLASLLRLRGYDVRTAADVATALRLLRDHEFDLVLTDWRLPDGTAAPLLAQGRTPVVAISGHPDEIEGSERLRAVLAKPVMPDRLFALLAQVAAASPGPEPGCTPLQALPLDVRTAVDRALALLGGGACELIDDGTFVTLRAPWSDDGTLPAFTALGGDVRILAPGGRAMVEVRWCRDGRPDPAVAVVCPGERDWPDTAEFCVDLDGGCAPDVLVGCLDRAATARRRGASVLFLNVSAAMRAVAAGAGRALELTTPDRIGPEVGMELTDLWG